MTLTFYGGVGTATGANMGLQCGEVKILIDCGLLQGLREDEEKNFEPFKYDPSSFGFLLVTHAHMDHIGKIPKLVREGFGGRIISTPETREIAEPMLRDALRVWQSRFPEKDLYEEKNIDEALSLWEGVKYGDKIKLGGGEAQLSNAGHILGSAVVNIFFNNLKISFTGDLGNSPSPLLPDVEPVSDADYLVMESVYGDRNHEDKKARDDKFKEIIKKSIARGGEIVIPAFSIERTQVILYELNNLAERGEIKNVPVFLDSPLAEKVTGIYKKYSNDFKEAVREQMKKDDIFNFPNLSIIKSANESQSIEKTPNPKIIIAGSGMSEGGRVANHESRIMNDGKSVIILVGYQAVGTFGRKLQEGAIKTKCKIENIEGYSSHMDSDHLLEFVSKIENPKKVFCIMGEPKSSLFLAQKIRDYLGVEAIYPELYPREYALI